MKNSLGLAFPLFDEFCKGILFDDSFKKNLNKLSDKFNNYRFCNVEQGDKWVDKVDYWTHTILADKATIETDEKYLQYSYEIHKKFEGGESYHSASMKLPFPDDADTSTVKAEKNGNVIIVSVDKKKKVYNTKRTIEVK